jgi:hypothetical protein
MSAQIYALQELQGWLLTGLEKIDARVNTLENLPVDETGIGSRAKKTAGGSRGGANEHPLVKVSQQIISPRTITNLTFTLASCPCIVL